MASWEGTEEELVLTGELNQATLVWLIFILLPFSSMTPQKEWVPVSMAEPKIAF
jgi:ABC-type transporter Mla MlaB component